MLKQFSLGIALTSCLLAHAYDYTVSPDGNSVTVNGLEHKLSESTFLLTHDNISGPYIFSDARAAIDAINRSDEGNITLLVTPWVYWIDDPDDESVRYARPGSVPWGAEIEADTLSIIGLSDNASDVVWAVNRGQTQGALGNYTMLHFTGKSLTVENMTMGNYCNCDLEYAPAPELNRKRRRDAIVQAQIGLLDSCDRLFARNVRFISRLNLCPLTGARRSLYKNCYFECTDDALTGSGLYIDCGFTFFSGKPFYSTASTGAILLNCDINCLTDGVQYFTKAPGMVTAIDTRFTADHPVTLRWTRDSSPIRCYQSGNTLNGKPVDIDADRQQLWSDLTDTQLLKAYKVTLPDGTTIYNTPNLLSGDDGWDPLGQLPDIRRAEALTGERLIGLPVAMKVTADRKDLAPQDDRMTLTASERLWGDYDCASTPSLITWSAPSTLSITGASGTNAQAVSANTFPKAVECVIDAATESGLKGAASVSIAPFLLDAPAITQAPAIEHSKQSLKLNYALTESDEADNSYIVWYRSTRPDLSDSTAVRHGCGLTAQTYPLTQADKGHYISATIYPRRANTLQGEGVSASLTRPVSGGMTGLLPRKESTLSTSWAEIPVRRSAPGRKGFWQFDSYKPADTSGHDWVADDKLSWYYGNGEDAARDGLGLVQATKGARLSYIPMRDNCHKMSLSIVAEPCKGPGQGFGSATSQYMDICVKFDPVTLTGYGLRIERTPEYDKAVTFTLVRYAGGKVSPISDPQPTSCFRNPCTIKVDITDSNIVATASTGAPDVKVSNPAIKPHVMLTAPVDRTPDTGLMIQHTGSVGASATLLRDLNVRWD